MQLDMWTTVDTEGAIIDMLNALSTDLNFTFIFGKAVIEKGKSSGLGDDIVTV